MAFKRTSFREMGSNIAALYHGFHSFSGEDFPPLIDSIRQWLIGNTGDKITDELDVVTPAPDVKHVGCVNFTSQDSIMLTGLSVDDVVTQEGTANITVFDNLLQIDTGTLGMVSINGVLTFPCQETGDHYLQLHSVNPLIPDIKFNTLKAVRGFSDLISSYNLEEGCSLTEAALIIEPDINPTTFYHINSYYGSSGGWIDWGDGSALEALSSTSAVKNSHYFPDDDESKYQVRIYANSLRPSLSPSNTGYGRKVLNSGIGIGGMGSIKNDYTLTHWKLGDFDSTRVWSLVYALQNRHALMHIDFSGKSKLKVSSLQSTFSQADMEEIDLTNLDTSECVTLLGAFSACSSLKRVHVTGLDFSHCNDYTNFMTNVTTLDTDNYNAFLIELVKTIKESGFTTTTISFGSSKYSGAEASAARLAIGAKGWIVIDGGEA